MSKDFDLVIDECIDRMNSGESVEQCLARYPKYAAELGPMLLTLRDTGDICSTMPGAEARSKVKQQIESAAMTSNTSSHSSRRILPVFGWPKVRATVAVVFVLALVGFGLYWTVGRDVTPVIAQTNFRLLLSDDPNAIADFSSLKVSISRIGVLRGGENGGWEEINLKPAVVVDLTRLQGLNAQEVWKGKLPEGQYRQVIIYIDNTTGILQNGTTDNVTVSSGKLQLSKPFAITTGGAAVSFVYDVTVAATGTEYILQPQLEQSGATEKFYVLGSGELTVQVIDGNVAPGETITIRVIFGMTTVTGASVTVNGEKVGNTDDTGIKAFMVPFDEELEIEVVKDEAKGELEIDMERESKEQETDIGELTLEIVSGDMLPGKNITILVTTKGHPLAGALVIADDTEIGTTGSDGRISFVVANVEELNIEAVKGEMEGKLKIDLQNESEDD